MSDDSGSCPLRTSYPDLTSMLTGGAIMGAAIWATDMLLKGVIIGGNRYAFFFLQGAVAIFAWNTFKQQTGKADRQQNHLLVDAAIAGFVVMLGDRIFSPLIGGGELIKFLFDGIFISWAIKFITI